jgi:RimJ/RimL family protein N-acetyltransferase
MAGAMTAVLETEHLRLRQFRLSDLGALAALVGDAEQMAFYPRTKTRAEADAWLRRNLTLYNACGFGFWLLESLRTSVFAGYCGIRPLELEGAAEIEIGWHTTKSSWNQGIATEAATAVRDLAFGPLGVSRLVAVIHPDHWASRRVAEKIGMAVERTTVLEEDNYPAAIYVVERH